MPCFSSGEAETVIVQDEVYVCKIVLNSLQIIMNLVINTECRDNVNPNPQFGVGLEDRWDVEVESGMLVFLAGVLAFRYCRHYRDPTNL